MVKGLRAEIKEISEELSNLKRLIENSNIFYQVMDYNGIILNVNKPWLECLGYKTQDVIGQSFDNFLDQDSVELFNRKKKNLKDPTINENLDLVLYCQDGSLINASFSCFGKRDENDEPGQIHCVFQNITRLAKAEKALELSEERYKRIFNSLLDVYYQTNDNSIITLISPSVEKAAGYKPDEVIGKSVIDFFYNKEDWEKVREEVFDKGYVDDYDLKLIDKSGKYIDVSVTANLRRDDEGAFEGVVGMIRDISERKKLEEEKAAFNQRMMDITENIPAILFQLKQSGTNIKVEYVSANVEKRIGIKADDLISDPLNTFNGINTNDQQKIIEEIKAAFKEKRPGKVEFRAKLKNGNKIWSRIIISPRFLESGEVIWTGISLDITEAELMRRELDQQIRNMENIFRFANVGFASMSLKGIVTSVNPTIEKITGYEENEIVGKHFKDVPVFYKKDLSFYFKLFQNALSGKLSKEPIVFEWKHKNGDKYWGEAFLNIIKDENKIKGFQGVFMDITKRIEIENKEKDQFEKFRYLFSTAEQLLRIRSEKELFDFLGNQISNLVPGAIININSVNNEMSKLYVETVKGLKPPLEGMIKKLLHNKLAGTVFNIDDHTFHYARHGKLIRYHTSLFELAQHQIPEPICKKIESLIKLDEFWEISLGVGNHTMGGGVIFIPMGKKLVHKSTIEILFRQATAALFRLRTYEKAKKNELQYKALAENAGDFIIRLNRDLEILYHNSAFNDFFELDHKQIKLNQIVEVEKVYIHIEKTFKESLKTGRSLSCDTAILLKNITYFFEWRIFPENNISNDSDTALIIIRDITERQVAQAKMKIALENKNKFFSMLSHDLRNPFNSILGFLNLLRSDYNSLSDEQRLNYIQLVNDSSENLLNLLNSIQEWSKDKVLDTQLEPVNFDFIDLINDSLGLFNAQIQDKKLRLVTNLPNGLVVFKDYNMIFAAVRNILNNAIKFSYPGGKIIISLSKRRNEVSFVIQDFGIGMSTEEIKELTIKKNRFSKKDTSGEKGTGFGFLFAMEMIEQNNGRIEIESKPGQGCRVVINLKD